MISASSVWTDVRGSSVVVAIRSCEVDRIHPREATGQLRAHPAVNDVCVIGVPHDVLGELVCARIAKVPDLVRFPTTVPKSGAGRVKRRALERTFALDHTAIIGST